ncbi:MAG: glycoside hydrolase family 18 protein, partial [Muribaculaceae bacterium]|nr:glycoside hydrolase family 18 protein [Muribaculaceae bacterium]
MRKRYIITSVFCIAIAAITTLAMWGQTTGTSLKRANEKTQDTTPKIALAYMVDRYDVLPDPEMFSHLIYAFGVFNDNYDGVVIRYPDKLKSMAALKEKNPKLKVILGLNDYRRPGFSEMARDKKKRKNYVKSVKKIIDEYNLDGVDLDWEFPTTEAGGHTAT